MLVPRLRRQRGQGVAVQTAVRAPGGRRRCTVKGGRAGASDVEVKIKSRLEALPVGRFSSVNHAVEVPRNKDSACPYDIRTRLSGVTEGRQQVEAPLQMRRGRQHPMRTHRFVSRSWVMVVEGGGWW